MVIRDPVHGDIALTACEVEVLDTPEMQRLRGIKQTGTANLVYPGCVHTRFEHSLGTMFLARRLVSSLRASGCVISKEDEQAIALAALIHDVTHVPYGHTLEDERRLFPRHDQGPRLDHLMEGDLGRVLRRQGYYSVVRQILNSKGAGPGDAPRGSAWMAQVVSSTIDADLLDYLRRDSYFAGLRHDYDERIFGLFIIDGGDLAINLTRAGIERPDARSEVIQLLRTRYFLTERVYFHHTKVCSGAMIAKAAEIGLEYGFKAEDMLWLDDHGFLRLLADFPQGKPDLRMRRLVQGVMQRRLLKRGYVLSPATVTREERVEFVRRFHEDRRERREKEAYIAERLGIGFEDVVIYCPSLSLMKEAGVRVRLPGKVVPLNDPGHSPPLELTVLEEQYEALWRFYIFVPEGLEGHCAKEAAALFGRPSEHTGDQ